ncbi:cell division protein ZapA [Nitrospinae bacterium AH_259_B05_G02_I21]|nr:cell division protein ZapA [Nitrospinae bacterium AH_259_B05_G02_I21]
MTQPIDIEIFGRTYKVKGEKDAAYTRQLAAYVDEQMRAVAERSPSSASPLQIAVLTLLQISNELFETQDDLEQSSTTIQNKSEELMELLDASLSEGK